ncbi:hypothetical protein [Pelagibacterium sp. H642]|uniref:hypothetical protein n=1 Tax=Pelagibacterium sp. H642 TaxID=1881069 RepID=UPI0028161BE8|nr:hypothetical protein [Pelagibacterium sp. H642]WMT89282.1 hypothetical protein NO934_10700 [Pelagibacterium sp. H642]
MSETARAWLGNSPAPKANALIEPRKERREISIFDLGQKWRQQPSQWSNKATNFGPHSGTLRHTI